MLNPGERGFNQGIDAKSELGPTWPQMVEDGILRPLHNYGFPN